MNKVDLNSDLGESFGAYTIGCDREIIRCVSSVNIACGWHAGDPMVMAETVDAAKESGTAVGAHPGFPDRMGFGRRNITVTPSELKNYVKYQLGALFAFCKSAGVRLQHLKAHGAMYNMAVADENLAYALCEAVAEVDSSIIMLGLANSKIIKAASSVGLRAANEVYADRAYMDDGTLVPRSREGAVIHDEELAVRRVVGMVKQGKVKSISGRDIEIQADSVCVHGDNPQALGFAVKIREALTAEGIDIVNLDEVVSR